MNLKGSVDNYETFLNVLQFISGAEGCRQLNVSRVCPDGEFYYRAYFKKGFLCDFETNDENIASISSLKDKFEAMFHTLLLSKTGSAKFDVVDCDKDFRLQNCVDFRSVFMNIIKIIDEVYPTLRKYGISVRSELITNPNFGSEKDVSLGPIALRILANIAQGKKLGDYIWKCGSPEEVLAELKNLLDISFLTTKSGGSVKKKKGSGEKFKKLKEQLIDILGPIALSLLDVAKEELGVGDNPTDEELMAVVDYVANLAESYKEQILKIKGRL